MLNTPALDHGVPVIWGRCAHGGARPDTCDTCGNVSTCWHACVCPKNGLQRPTGGRGLFVLASKTSFQLPPLTTHSRVLRWALVLHVRLCHGDCERHRRYRSNRIHRDRPTGAPTLEQGRDREFSNFYLFLCAFPLNDTVYFNLSPGHGVPVIWGVARTGCTPRHTRQR